MKRILFLLAGLLLTSCAATAPYTFVYTNPSTNANIGSCTGTLPLTDLKEDKFYGRIFGRSDSVFLGVKSARSGLPDSFTATVQETLWDFWAISFDSTGNSSCQSNIVRKRVANNPSPPTLQ